ncbi:MAG: hypothetical protein J0L92_38265 [Deltaproteobacteria bacterium]|nr:hypothetical protein [Deltaproteobacteria bacterium]
MSKALRAFPTMIPSAALGALATLLAGCPTTTSTPDAPATPDAFVQASDAPAPTVDAPRCDLAPIPTPLPMLESAFVVESETVMPPVPSGEGDPTGTWLFDHVSFYVSAEAGMNFDPTMSSVEGAAWLAFDGSEVRLEMSFVIMLADTLAGDITRATETRIRGTYAMSGGELVFTPSCVESAMMAGAAPSFDFGVESDRGTLVIETMGMLGRTTIVLEGGRM